MPNARHPAQARVTILREIRRAIDGVVALRNATTVKKGYLNFDLAEKALRECREAIADTRDRERIVPILEAAHTALELFRAGDAAPAVESGSRRSRNC